MKEEKVLEEQKEVKKEATQEGKKEEEKKDEEVKKEKEVKPTAESVEAKKEKAKLKYKDVITKLQNDLAKVKDQFLREKAEMENSKRRIKEEAIKDRKYASQKLITELLTPLDMLVKVVNMPTSNPEIENFLKGFKMITNQFFTILENDGLKEIKALGEEFDPTIHEAISQEEKQGEKANIVTEVLETGYMYKDRLIKPSRVKISK